MSDQSRATSRDFAFQTSDQASGASQPYPQQSYNSYNADQDTSTAETASQAPVYDVSTAYRDYVAQQHQLAQGQFGGFNFASQAPAAWDWTNSLNFAGFTNQNEPQGELVQEFQDQANPTNDFSIPFPVTNNDSAYPPFQQQPPSASSPPPPPPPNASQAQIPLSPPAPPPRSQQQQQRPVVQTGMKRKLDSEPSSAVSQTGGTAIENPSKRINKPCQLSDASATSPVISAPIDIHAATATTTTTTTRSTAPPMPNETASQPAPRENTQAERRKEQSKGTGPQGRVIDVSTPRKIQDAPSGIDMLPAGKVFPIQIGSELFRLSGASLSSDAPSYFSHFFGQQLHDNGGRAGDVRTLYIDRDPETFRDIALHLQGYHITPKDGEHFVKLYADAQFYSLPRLTKQLFGTDIFVRIGGAPFQIPRDLFSAPGDSPNFFSLGFAHFFLTPTEAFPGLDRDALLRPPSIKPPSVPNRNGETFNELIQILQGYNVEIRNSKHRSKLLRDARYFHLKGLEQKLIPCEISFNVRRQQSEILVRLEDIRPSGVSFMPDKTASGDSDSGSVRGGLSISASPQPVGKIDSPAPSNASSSAVTRAGYVSYARPYTDDHANSSILILEISSTESTSLFLPWSAPKASRTGPLEVDFRATFHNSTLSRVTSLFSVIASKMGLPATQPLGLMHLQSGGGVAAQPVSPANSGVSDRRVRVRLETDCALEIDGAPAELGVDNNTRRLGIRRANSNSTWLWGGNRLDSESSFLRADEQDLEVEWTLKRAHWRIRVEPLAPDADGDVRRMQVILCGVRLEVFTAERTRNASRRFLG